MNRTYLRRTVVAGVTLAAAVALAGCGGGDHNAPSGHDMGTSPSASQAGHNAADVMFAQMMIPHHQQAVEMSDLAETRAADPEVKKLAAQIKAAQAPEIATMNGWLTVWGSPMPMPSGTPGMGHGMGSSTMPGMGSSSMPGMDHGMPGMMSDADMKKLRAASGRDFDQQYLTMMIAHHQGAITMARTEVSQGTNPEAKALAGRIIGTQQSEIDTMKKILARL